MYLDTDILLALIKQKDWLKPYIKMSKIKNPKTSTLAVIEAEIILLREYDRKDIFDVMKKLENLKIEVLETDKKVMGSSIDLMKKYPRLNVFDSVHAAFSIVHKESILSTDLIFDTIEGLRKIDPRDLGGKGIS